MKCSMTVDYNSFAKSFAQSRKNMKWAELEYFFSRMNQWSILDIWCGSGRLLEQYKIYFWDLPTKYLWIDLSRWLLDEAEKSFPDMKFLMWNMMDISEILLWESYDNIFMIASFHHLQTFQERGLFIQDLYENTSKWTRVFLTNWALNSDFNSKKYLPSKIDWSESDFWGLDYNIKIWSELRYYHCFSLEELETLFLKVGFKILENRIFDWERNFITILEK